jgi:hypothetical protein
MGACGAARYFLNILPLRNLILERTPEAGEDVTDELNRARKVLETEDVKAVPAELLPWRQSPEN